MRYIDCTVQDEYIVGDGVFVGASGSHDDVALRLSFGEMWDGLQKTVQFTDALGSATVERSLTDAMIADGAYLVPIPFEAKRYPGEMTVTVKGAVYAEPERSRPALRVFADGGDDGGGGSGGSGGGSGGSGGGSGGSGGGSESASETCATLAVRARFLVKDSGWDADAAEAHLPSPSDAALILSQTVAAADSAAGSARDAAGSAESAAGSARDAAGSADSAAAAEHGADLFKQAAQNAMGAASSSERAAAASASAAAAEANRAVNASSHPPIIGANGYWMAWDGTSEQYVETEHSSVGLTGAKGDKGDTGATGAKGDKGDKGDTGATGAKGDKGDKGETGAKGDKGDKGATGATGATGQDGVSPAIAVSSISGGHRVTVTDAAHPQGQSFDVMDGASSALTVDDEPTADSTNLVQSGGVFAMLENMWLGIECKQDLLTAGSGITIENGVISATGGGAGSYELVQKIVVGYSLLTAEPSDWATAWTSYYTNTGTATEPVYTALTDATAPTWQANTYYKRRASVSSVSYADATGFSKVCLVVQMAAAGGSGYYTVSFNNATTNPGTPVTTRVSGGFASSAKTSLAECDAAEGAFFAQARAGSTLTFMGDSDLFRMSGKIKYIQLYGASYDLPADSVVAIYGMR